MLRQVWMIQELTLNRCCSFRGIRVHSLMYHDRTSQRSANSWTRGTLTRPYNTRTSLSSPNTTQLERRASLSCKPRWQHPVFTQFVPPLKRPCRLPVHSTSGCCASHKRHNAVLWGRADLSGVIPQHKTQLCCTYVGSLL